jgi:CubicO group peptidase (beta-lactamase class C family)
VYARGYTNAETSYPDILPTTPFRQASISKTFCAVAIWKLIEQHHLTLDTTLQSVLHLTQPDGSAPKDTRFGDIKIKHLLTSTSGINQGGVWHAVDGSEAAGGTLPSNGTEVARWVTTLDLTSDPGDPHNVVYGNTDYFLLSLVLAKKMDAASFEAALNTLVLNPLGMTRTRGARSLIGAQHDTEARYHMTVHNAEADWALFQLECLNSVKTDEQPLVTTPYGSFDIDMFDGCGGLSSAVIDVARLCAMFACRAGNPVLTSDTIDDMLAAAVAASEDLDGPDSVHGFHGFDGAYNVDLTQHQVHIKKGGWLPGMGTSYVGTTGGFVYVLAKNGNTPADVDLNWHEMIEPLVEAHAWGGGDLFPSFGMPSLTGFASADPKVTRVVDKLSILQTMRQVEASMARGRIVRKLR